MDFQSDFHYCLMDLKYIPYFFKYNAQTSIVRTWISQWFLAKKHYFYFSRIISQELTIASLFIIKAILNLSQLPSMYSLHGIFQHHFQCIKVHTILDKIQCIPNMHGCLFFYTKTITVFVHNYLFVFFWIWFPLECYICCYIRLWNMLWMN